MIDLSTQRPDYKFGLTKDMTQQVFLVTENPTSLFLGIILDTQTGEISFCSGKEEAGEITFYRSRISNGIFYETCYSFKVEEGSIFKGAYRQAPKGNQASSTTATGSCWMQKCPSN